MRQDKRSRSTARWKDLAPAKKAAIAALVVNASRRGASAFSVRLGPQRLEKAHGDSRGTMDHLRRVTREQLGKRLGRDPSFWIAVTGLDGSTATRQAPLRGIVAAEPHETPALLSALEQLALQAGAVDVRRPDDPLRWTASCFRLPAGHGQVRLAMADRLRNAAREAYDRGHWRKLRGAFRARGSASPGAPET